MRIAGKGTSLKSGDVRFHFNNRPIVARRGDTVASALLANDVKLVGRSFKYHRPRGIFTAGSEEPNALIQVGADDAQLPNQRATIQEVFSGLETSSQNHIGPLNADILSVNDLFPALLTAGFYYKTFMWPRSFWEKLYEPLIRRAAGLGRMSRSASPEESERAFAHCDVLVIGGGPTGLIAALAAARGGADVIIADEAADLGGRLVSDGVMVDGRPPDVWVAEIVNALLDTGRARIMTRTSVTGVYDGHSFGALERVSTHLPSQPGVPRECFWRIRAKQAILASGALERPIAFPMNDRPGIMMASALRTYLNRYGVASGASVSLFVTNDDAHETAIQLQEAGVEIAAVVDPRPDATARGDYRLLAGSEVISTRGRQRLREISVRRADGAVEQITTDCLGLSGGWNPNVHLTCHLGARPVWDEARQAFLPRPGAVPGLHPAGASAGQLSTLDCMKDGLEAARNALSALGKATSDAMLRLPQAPDQAGSSVSLWAVEGKGRAWLDFANDVTTKDVVQSAQEAFRSVEHMKRYTTQGMAPDQGKSSNVAALAILADATGQTIPETGTTTYRPPFVPVPLAAMGAGAQGQGYAPIRKTRSHQTSEARGAPMVEAGLWYRAAYFPQPGETQWRHSCDREVQMVRSAVGITDVSTLGKIEILGPDAGAFLDFLYTNTFSTLKPGKMRYGLMLREDGHVMDDGTTACLGDGHYVMTTTTAAAGQVMAHLDFVAQCLKPGLDVRFTSVTEQWSQFAIAGPRARELVNGLLDQPLAEGEFGFMACGEVSVHGQIARLFRVSFSGEHGYEIAVPTRFGDALYRELVARAEAMGGGAYGMEALNVLRIEKGFLTHAEIDGRVTAFDVGLNGMLSRKKDFIGKAAASRDGLLDPRRPRLVGIKPTHASGETRAGAHLFEPGAARIAANSLGYVTSSGYSPTLGSFLALGFLATGPERYGETLLLVDRTRGIEIEVEIMSPVFFDAEGERLRG